MYKITIISVGSLKNIYHKELFFKYIKQLKPYAVINNIEVKAESFSASTKNKAIDKENKRLLDSLEKQRAYKILLSEHGKNIDSFKFAELIDNKQNLVFVIGGALGFGKEIKKQVDLVLSLSALTFPHELARVMLVEQLYRAATINNNKVYNY